MINKLCVNKLNYQFEYKLNFYENLNLLTGPNGLGKTALLKLIWYLTSGNLHRIISEIPLEVVTIETNQFQLSMELNSENIELKWEFSGETQGSKVVKRNPAEDLENILSPLNEKIADTGPGSLFFSTFRRIESGFPAEPTITEALQETLSNVSGALSSDRHKFIVSLSTRDIVALLSQKHKRLNQLREQNDSDASEERETLEQRFELLNVIVKDLYEKYGGIKITDDLILDGTSGKDVIPSNNLSSGEKQLLGLLSYNAFFDNVTVYIDEPELSLHLDVQRLIVPILRGQGTEKQFFLATHTPYIYARYENEQIQLDMVQEEINDEI